MSNRDLLPLGRQIDGKNRGELAPIEWPLHFVGVGGSQFGKTELAICIFLQHVLVRQEGGLFIDPTGTAVAKMKRFLGAEGVAERVRELHRDHGRPQLSYNPLDMTDKDRSLMHGKLEAFVDLFVVMQGWDSKTNQRAINVTLQTVLALMELNLLLPPHLQATIFQMSTFLTNIEWRKVVLQAVPERLSAYWDNEFKTIGKDAAPPVTHYIHAVREDPALSTLLGTSRSNFDLRTAMDERQIVLASIGRPGVASKFMANLLLHDLVAAFFSRGRRGYPRFLFELDEAQTYDGAASGSIADLLEGVAKFDGLGGVWTQNFLRLKEDTQRALLTNRRLLISFNLELEAAVKVGKGWTQGPEPTVLPSLAPYEAIIDTYVGGRKRPPWRVRTRPAEEAYARHLNDAAVPALQKRLNGLGRHPEEVSRELDVLDAAILEHLRSLGKVREVKQKPDDNVVKLPEYA